MTNKFDTNKRNFLICFGVSILVLLFNLEINQISFFDKLDIPKKIEIYFLLLINTYLYFEVLTSWLLVDLKSELSKKIYNINFSIACLCYTLILLVVIYKTLNIKIAINYTLFSILILITLSIIYFLFLFLIRLIISIYISSFDVITNSIYIVFNLLILYLIINKLLVNGDFNRVHLVIFIVALIITSSSFVYFLIKNNYIRNYSNKRVYFNQMFQNSNWLNKIIKKEVSERKQIIKHANTIQELTYILNDKELPIESKIVHLIVSGKTQEVIEVFDRNKDLDINHKRNNGWTYLHTSVSEGEYEITKFLLENGIEMNVKNQLGLFPIYFAVSYGFIDILKLLIDYHADVDAKDSRGETLIFHAIRNNNLEIVKLLVESGANLKVKVNRISPVKFSQNERKGKITKYLKSVLKK